MGQPLTLAIAVFTISALYNELGDRVHGSLQCFLLTKSEIASLSACKYARNQPSPKLSPAM